MTGSPTPSTWYFREGGVVTQTAHDVADPARFHCENAYRKAWRQEALTADERAAAEAAKGSPLWGGVAGDVMGDTALGFLALQAPELLQQFDVLVEKMGERLGGFPFMAWAVAVDYAQRGLAVTRDECGLFDLGGAEDFDKAFDAGSDLARFNLSPERVAEIVAERAEAKAELEAWEGSPEQLANAADMTPDDGPEGWSQVPGGDLDKAAERQQAFAARYRASLNRGAP